jgi:hypothetical protein
MVSALEKYRLSCEDEKLWTLGMTITFQSLKAPDVVLRLPSD